MSGQCERTSERTSELPSTLRADFIVILLNLEGNEADQSLKLNDEEEEEGAEVAFLTWTSWDLGCLFPNECKRKNLREVKASFGDS